MLKVIVFFAVSALAIASALASDAAQKYVPNAAKVGSGKLSIVLLDIFEATLFAPNGKWNVGGPYALSIRYFQTIGGDDIAARSVDEMRNQGFSDDVTLAAWQKQMQAIFPDVKNGAELTAVFTAEKFTDFYANGRAIGSIKNAEFSVQFFNIWLGKNTSEPALRKKLLGL